MQNIITTYIIDPLVWFTSFIEALPRNTYPFEEIVYAGVYPVSFIIWSQFLHTLGAVVGIAIFVFLNRYFPWYDLALVATVFLGGIFFQEVLLHQVYYGQSGLKTVMDLTAWYIPVVIAVSYFHNKELKTNSNLL